MFSHRPLKWYKVYFVSRNYNLYNFFAPTVT
jgi:hypothetical protein